jgi:hypothetical protein
MLNFRSGSTRVVNPGSAVEECITLAGGAETFEAGLVILNASIGHNLLELSKQTRAHFPQARVVGTSCAGVVGREGVSETLKDVAMMLVSGKEYGVAHVDNLSGDNSFESGRRLAGSLKAQQSGINMIYLIGPGIDISNDALLAGIEDVLGSDVTIFGATSSDNMRGVRTFQVVDDRVFEHAAFAVGFADPTLVVNTMATHGFLAVNEPMVVTKARGNRILELDGEPAWRVYTRNMSLPETASPADTIPIGALAEELAPELATEYGNPHILRVVTHTDEDNSLIYATDIKAGTRLWLTVRDEELIFSDMDRMVGEMFTFAGSRKPVAVFQADCLARGRRLFNRIVKEELVHKMQYPFSTDDSVPPWLGMYGFGEYARLGGANAYHNYTTALAAIYRK